MSQGYTLHAIVCVCDIEKEHISLELKSYSHVGLTECPEWNFPTWQIFVQQLFFSFGPLCVPSFKSISFL